MFDLGEETHHTTSDARLGKEWGDGDGDGEGESKPNTRARGLGFARRRVNVFSRDQNTKKTKIKMSHKTTCKRGWVWSCVIVFSLFFVFSFFFLSLYPPSFALMLSLFFSDCQSVSLSVSFFNC